jgi:hypothetical protein
MALLASLKLTAAKKPQHQSPVVQRRHKMSKRLWEQIELAKAEQTGDTFTVKRLKNVRNAEGVRQSLEVAKRIRPWWFITDTGKICLNIRYGSKLIQLAKDKTAIELNSKNDLVPTLEAVKAAIEAGELDHEIEMVSGNLRLSFKR